MQDCTIDSINIYAGRSDSRESHVKGSTATAPSVRRRDRSDGGINVEG